MLITKLEDLEVYTISFQLAKEIKELIYKIPHYWTIGEASQILRSSSSVPANIAEGFGQRFYVKKLIAYLNNALGSSDETQNHLRKLNGDGYITDKDANDFLKRYKNLSVKILNWINYLKKKHQVILS